MQTIEATVGRDPDSHCRNTISDQITIATLLNRIPEHFGGCGGNLQLKVIDGWCPDELYQAIIHFQAVNLAGIKPDGKIKPDGNTLHYLNRLAERSFPIQKSDDYIINSFVEDLYEETLAEAHRDYLQTKAPELLRRRAKSV